MSPNVSLPVRHSFYGNSYHSQTGAWIVLVFPLESCSKQTSLLKEKPLASYASIRRFEKTGDISLASLVKLALALQLYDDLDNLFKNHHDYKTIEEIINDQKD